ncbi:MAG: sugar ABC transporter permease [Clostridia bacterium]|nr:sugar ABC transporter permease [Clostridia bacterium]
MERYETMTPLDYLKLNKLQKIWCRIYSFIFSIPTKLLNLLFSIGRLFKRFGLYVAHEFMDVLYTFKNGDWKTRLSFVIMGFGCFARGQILRGILFLLFEIIFLVYMSIWGWYWLAELALAETSATETITTLVDQFNMITMQWETVESTSTVYVTNSLHSLIYGILTIVFIIAFIYTWRVNVKQQKLAQQILASGKKLKSGKDDLNSLVDDQFHKTVLALPVAGITIFTVMPIILMIMVAFTNFDGSHQPPANVFNWIGLDNFNQLFSWQSGSSSFSATFGEILSWTLIWAFFATFSNYFLGMFVAMMINKKGIKFKKVWRTILVMTIAVPQFISLIYISNMFDVEGFIGYWLKNHGYFINGIWSNGTASRVMVIIINIWVGIPYLMLITSGVLMNIPADLYESARIDGANVFQMYCKITLPYMLFVTGPYLLTSFINNMNNFNVIYLLTGGAPNTLTNSGGETDLLVTWLYKLTINETHDYKLAAVIGIMVFVVCAVISLIIYNVIPSTRNEEEFQ